MHTVATQLQSAASARGDLIDPLAAGTLWELFRERVRRTPHRVAYIDYEGVARCWRSHTWHDIAARTDRLRAALARTPIQAGDRIALLLPNCVDWVCLDLAAHGSGLVVVALYPHDNPANIAHILGHSDARLLLVENEAKWRSLSEHRAGFPGLANVWIRDGIDDQFPPAAPFARSLAEVLQEVSPPPASLCSDPSALATLIYTSGTTGRPKGVMLSHAALLWNAKATADIIPPRPDDVFLSVLPLAHAFERTVGYYLPMMGGSAVAHARSPQDFREDLASIRPTVVLGVPLLFERMYAAIQATVRTHIVKRALLHLAAALGWRRRSIKGPGSFVARLLWPLLERLVATPVMAAFGGRLRVAVSGGAPLDANIARFLVGIGLPLVEGYGLTETAPVVTATTLDDSVPGSVGRPLPGIEIRISDQGELLVRSPSMMRGYWKDDAQTAHAINEGWLATGDLAEIRDGRISIKGRMKDMIVLSIGEKVNPNTVEAEIVRDPLFLQAAVIGDRRPYLVAIIVLNTGAWTRFARENGLDAQQPNAAKSKAKIIARLGTCLAALPRYAQVRAAHLTLETWTIDTGLLTPTLKVKRDVLQRTFTQEIDALYA